MSKRVFVILMIIVFFIQIISAIDTEIKVKTLSEHRVSISVLRPGELYSLIKSFHKDSGTSGEVSVVVSSEEEKFNIAVWVKKDNVIVAQKKFEDEFPAGIPITLEVYPSWYTPPIIENKTNVSQESEIVNETINETVSEEFIQENETKSEGTGFIISGLSDNFLSKKNLYYIVGGVIVILAIFLSVLWFKKRKFGDMKEIKVKKLSEFRAEEKDKIKDYQKIMSNAERKIKEAQEEIRRLKNEDKIIEIKRKIEEDKKELRRLEKGEE